MLHEKLRGVPERGSPRPDSHRLERLDFDSRDQFTDPQEPLLLWGGGEVEFFHHSHEVGEGLHAGLLHDVGAVEFDGSFGRGEFVGHLFVQKTGGNEQQHFALAGREFIVALAQRIICLALVAGHAVTLDRCVQNIEQDTTAESLARNSAAPAFINRACRDVSPGVDEDNRNGRPRVGESTLQFNATESSHTNFEPDGPRETLG